MLVEKANVTEYNVPEQARKIVPNEIVNTAADVYTFIVFTEDLEQTIDYNAKVVSVGVRHFELGEVRRDH